MKLKKLLVLLTPILSSAFLGFTPLPSQAEEVDCTAMRPRPYVEPNVLANMAFRGTFEKEGIPGYTILRTEFESGAISAEDIVEAAIKACYLSDRYGMNKNAGFAEDVENQLNAIYED